MTDQYSYFREMTEKRLRELFEIKGINEKLRSAMEYSVTAGGKRLRPVLNLLANSLLDGNAAESLDIACAIEMIHTYSLIHDDLPAMDNDELRRGKPTNHIMFGENFAILAGDGLLSYAFEVMLDNISKYPGNMENEVRAVSIMAKSAGIYGMVCGQASDVELEGQILGQKEIDYIHERKTGAMIKGALLSGLVLCSPDDSQYAAVELFGRNIGTAFQIIDDILDVVGNEKDMGKTLGKDKDSHKFTYPVLFGVDRSFEIAKQMTEEANEAISVFGQKAATLQTIASDILKRKN